MSKKDVNMNEYVLIHYKRFGSEYVLYNLYNT